MLTPRLSHWSKAAAGSDSHPAPECWDLDFEWIDQNYESSLCRQLHCDSVRAPKGAEQLCCDQQTTWLGW